MENTGDVLGLEKLLAAVQDFRSVKTGDIVHHSCLPNAEIHSQAYGVRAHGQLLTF